MLRLAHRGDWRHAPENTLAAFAAALAVPGCDGVEFDVRLSSDRVPVVAHDDTLGRVFGRAGRIDEMTSMIPHAVTIDVDLKGLHDRAVVEVLAAGRGPELVNGVVSSFLPETLERVGRLAPRWRRWLNARHMSADTIRTARDLGCEAVSLEFHGIDEHVFETVRSAGLDVAAWTVRRRDTYGRLERLGVVAACVEAAALDG
jgi:glycerophosphoryl diester phosphodiesterase